MTPAGNCFAIFVMWLACASFASSRCTYDAEECSCFSKSLRCNNLQTLPTLQTGAGVTAVEEAYFTGSSTGNISEVLDNDLPPGLVVLKFNSNPLTNISDGAFTDSADTLRILSIYRAKFISLPAALLQISHLTSLELSSTDITFWDHAILQHLATSLTSLTLTSVGLLQWPTWLSSFHSLTGLAVDYDDIYTIPDDAFSALNDTLVQLSLKSSRLTHIPSALLNLRNLKALDLSSNRLTEVSGRPGIEQLSSFPFAKTLLSLTVNFVYFAEIPDLTNLTSLEVITLGYNDIENLTTDSLPLSVTTLKLQSNKITSVPADIAQLTRLSYLDLSFNDINEINIDVFPSNLTHIDLGYNNITLIPDSTSTGISSIESLYLSNNPISTISPLAFRNLVSLHNLYLDGTYLTHIPLALTSLTKLYSLSMRDVVSLDCPCPPPTELVQWYRSLVFFFQINGASCTSGLDADDYIRYPCPTN